MLRRRRWAIAAALGVCAAVWLSSALWLPALGAALVSTSEPPKADAIVVLAGDYRGYRMMHACELAQRGVAPVILVSGPMETYGVNEADLAIRYAVSKGCPPNLMQPAYIKALSTVEEAYALKPEFQRRGIRGMVIVTSNYHTARALRTFRRIIDPSVAITMSAAPDPYFSVDRWWHTREGQKTLFFEMSKTVADWVGL